MPGIADRPGGAEMRASNEELRAIGVRKAYGATVALENADINLRAGEVHALLGENGAGKSTLVRILTGAVVPDAGNMTLHGEIYCPQSIMEARQNKVATAFQELSLVPNLSVAQNLLLPSLPKKWGNFIDPRRVVESAKKILDRNGMSRIDPRIDVAALPLAERQRLEIVRAIENAGRVLILDEPTASLAETDWLFDLVAKATSRGVAVLYISHRLAEVRAICSMATVLRNGKTIATVSLSDASDDDIFEMMVGRRVEHERPARSASAVSSEVRLSTSGLTGQGLRDASLELRPGEILGVAALEGQGQRGLFRMLAGLESPESGTINLDGRAQSIKSPRDAMKLGSGMAYLPEERKTEGILAGLSSATNIVLPIISKVAASGFVGSSAEARAAGAEAGKVEMSQRYLTFDIGDLSGGNQQKALIARVLATGVRTLLLFDPTRGVDVGTKQSIYAAIRTFAEGGGSVLFYSSELPEVVHLADRCIVIYGGSIVGSFSGRDLNERQLVAAMVGHHEKSHQEELADAN